MESKQDQISPHKKPKIEQQEHYTQEYRFVLVHTHAYISKDDSFPGPHMHILGEEFLKDNRIELTESGLPELHGYGTAKALSDGNLGGKLKENTRKTLGINVALGGTSEVVKFGKEEKEEKDLLKDEAFVVGNKGRKITFNGEVKAIDGAQNFSFLQGVKGFDSNKAVKFEKISANDRQDLSKQIVAALPGAKFFLENDLPFVATGTVRFLKETLHVRTVDACHIEEGKKIANESLGTVVKHQHNYSPAENHDHSVPNGGHIVDVQAKNGQPGIIATNVEAIGFAPSQFRIHQNEKDTEGRSATVTDETIQGRQNALLVLQAAAKGFLARKSYKEQLKTEKNTGQVALNK